MTTERDVTSEPEGRKSNIEKEKTEVSFLYLSEEDMVDAGVLNAARCVDVMEETIGLMEDGDFIELSGEIYQGKFEEFYPDMDELKEIVINLFYKEKA